MYSKAEPRSLILYVETCTFYAKITMRPVGIVERSIKKQKNQKSKTPYHLS